VACTPKILEGKNVQNSARFRTTSGFDLHIAGADNAIDKLNNALSTTITPTLDKKMVNFGPLTTEFMWLLFTHLKSTVRAIRTTLHFDREYLDK